MIFTETEIKGVYILEIEALEDERGFFARTVCKEEFARHGLCADFVQQSVSYNKKSGTLRGMHWQAAPHEEEKLVRCTMGSIWDVAVDIRAGSPTYKKWVGVELSAKNRRAIYIPKGIVHGFQTLEDDSEVFYEMSVPYRSESSRGFRWDDPQIGIIWPIKDGIVIGQRDLNMPHFGT